MRFTPRANSIIEVMVVIVVLTTGLIGAYSIISKGQDLSRTTEKRIQAINIAREGLEAVQNIRDTNWLQFSSDYTNCWMTNNYNVACVGDPSIKYADGNYVLTMTNNKWWRLENSTASGVWLDTNGLSVQGGTTPSSNCSPSLRTNCKTSFTRTIQLNFTEPNHVKVTSTVNWSDSSSKTPHTVSLDTTLTNWKLKQ